MFGKKKMKNNYEAKIMKTKKQTKNKKEVEVAIISCLNKECKGKFGVDVDYIGIVTCPYCGEYVEG